MAKKTRPAPSQRSGFDPETNRWFTPVIFLFFFIALVFLFSDFVFSDQMLSGSDTLRAGYAFRDFYIESLRHFDIPQWMPYNFGGLPYVEAFHGDIFYPLTWPLKMMLPLKRALGWGLFWHIFLAGVFMYLAARQFKLYKVPSLFAAACYMFAGYLVSMVAPGHDGKIFVTALYPLSILFLDRGFNTRPLLNFSLMGLVIGLIILTPHPQMAYFTLWSLGFYTAFKLIVLFREKKNIMALVKPGALAAYAVAVGLALSAIQFYPGVLYTNNYSPRGESKSGWEWAISWSLHEEEAMGLLIPEFAGTSTDKAKTYYWGKNYFKDNAETVGTVTFFAALLGFLFYRRKESYFFGGLALFALIYALGGTTPIFRLFYWLIPKVSSLRAPSMIMFLFSFSVSLLAAMGLQKIMEARVEKEKLPSRFTYVLFGYPGMMFLLALLFSAAGKGMMSTWCSVFYSDAARTQIQQGVTKLDVAYMNLPAIQSGAWFAFLFSAAVAAGIWLYVNRKAGIAVLIALIAIPVVDGVRFDSRFVKLVDDQEFHARFEPNRITDYLSNLKEKFRVINFREMQGNTLPHFGIDVVVGYHGNQLRWYDELLGGPNLSSMNPPNVRLLNLVGAKYVMIPTGARLPGGFLGKAPVDVVMDNGRDQLLVNHNALPRAFLVDEYEVITDRAELVNRVLKGNDILSRKVLLEEEPALPISPSGAGTDSCWIVDYQTDSVRVGISTTANRLLVLTDNYFDAWQVYVDGSPAPLLRADAAFRAVAVPAGASEVRFVYHSQRYATGRLVTLISMVYLFGIIGILVYRGHKRTPEPVTEDETEQ
ncbi:MAG: YfhO family protein [candidate division Zixibacteria bacterium]|nr:YfhO family protein [candidate division Zixibacteria bacterium]